MVERSAALPIVGVPEKASSTLFDARDELRSTHTSELVIALCGPIGSPIHSVADKLTTCLTTEFGYEKCGKIRLSEMIREHSPGAEIPTDEYGKISKLISLGDDLRK